jgi:Uma2 family endonuclease
MEIILQEPAIAYPRQYSVEEYLQMEWENGVRYEYWEGELVAMAVATLAHNRIASNINRTFQDKKRQDNCGSFQESLKVCPNLQSKYFLPDVVLTCHPDDMDMQAY